MTQLSGLSSDSVKALGAGASLVSALPSAVFLLGVFFLVASRLYPWSKPLQGADGSPVEPGIPSVVFVINQAGIIAATMLVLVVLATALLMRPFQIALVQLLEGYWREGPAREAAVERHRRRRTRLVALQLIPVVRQSSNTLAAAAAYQRRRRFAKRTESKAESGLAMYPDDDSLTMPTRLGNLLRRGESSAGERYGLATVETYPRLYPLLSPKLDEEMREVVNVLDSSSAFCFVFGGLGVITLPLLGRLDAWSIAPVVLLSLSALAYRGACSSASLHIQQLSVAYDLHRFDMLAALHRELPPDTDKEREWNQDLSRRIGQSQSELARSRYRHATSLDRR